ncbi:MAG: lamin tail domain-containing protein [Polyangiaceae bacterium]
MAATCSDGFLHNQGTGDETDVDCGGTVCNACPGGVLLSELVVTPTDGEFIELYNPTTETVDLSNVYLADFNTYYLVTQGTATVVSSDFLVKFPLGTSLAADARVTIALETATSHNTNYGSFPDFDLSPADVAAPSMELLGATTVAGGLTNSGEMLVAFYWDGTSDLVKDIDYITYGNTTNAMDKTGVTVGAGTYLAETAVLSQDPGANPGSLSLSRCDFAEGTETQTGGNGYLGHDETSENSSATWSATTPSPGGSNLCPSTATAALNFGDAKILASATDLSGDLIVVGSYTEAPLVVGAFTLPNAGADDLFVAKISGSDNSVTWAVGFGGTSSDLAQAVAIDPGTGDVFVGGAYQSATLDFTGGLGTALTNSGGGQFDAFVAKLSGVDGSHLWSVGAGGSGSYDTVNGLAAEATGDVVAAGFFESTSINFGTTTLVNSGTGTGEAFAVRLGGSAGAEVWAILSGVSTTASDQFFGVAIDGAGGFVYLVGHGNGFGNGNYDPFVEQVDLATGVSSDVTTGDGASGDDFAYTVAVDSAGGIAVGGQFSSATVDWSGAITTSVSSSGDAYVVTLDTGTTGLPALAAWTPTAASAASQIKSLLYVGLNPYAGGAFSGAGFDAGGGAMADAGGGFNTLVVSLDASLAHRYSLTGSNASGVDTVDSLAGGSAGLFASGGFGAASLDWGGTSSALTNLGGTDAFAVRIVP